MPDTIIMEDDKVSLLPSMRIYVLRLYNLLLEVVADLPCLHQIINDAD
jgi:hypothetical protein